MALNYGNQLGSLGMWNGTSQTVAYYHGVPTQVDILAQMRLYEQLSKANVKENEDMSVSSKIKELSKDNDSKLLAKYGVTNDCGDLTSEGKQVLWDMLFAENKEAIVAKLKELEAAEKKAAK